MSKLKYIPLYSPAPVKISHTSSQTTPFQPLLNSSAINQSTSCVVSDRRRSFSDSSLCDLSFQTPGLTISMAQTPDAHGADKCIMPVKRTSHLDHFLVTSTPPNKKTANRPKPSRRILTSKECIKIVEEKEREKKEALIEKEAKKNIQQAQLKKSQKSIRGEHYLELLSYLTKFVL